MARIRRSPQSNIDYLEIWSFIAKDNRAAADKVLRTFEEKLELIACAPGIGRLRDELFPLLRSFPVGNYLLFYRPISDGIELVRILHGARNLEDMFRD